MALIKCPDCGYDVSDIAPACPRCGRPIQGQPGMDDNTPPTAPVTNPDIVPEEKGSLSPVHRKAEPNYLQLIFGMLGALAILTGVFMPLVRGSGESFASLFGSRSIFGYNFLFWGLIALGLVAVRRFREIAIPSVAVLGLTIFLYVAISGQEGGGYLEYGFAWALLAGGAVVLIVSSILPSKCGTRFPILLVLAALANGVLSFLAVKAFSEITSSDSPRAGHSSTQAVLGIDSNPFEGTVTLVSINVEGIPLVNGSGGSWDNFNPNPDPFLVIKLNGEPVHTTAARSESSGSAFWSIGEQIYIDESSQLKIEMWDEDMSDHDPMFNLQFSGSRLSWGENVFPLDNGMTITLEFR